VAACGGGDDAPAADAQPAAIDASACDPTRTESSVDVGAVSLDVAFEGCAEDTIVFLHGFPEIAYGWAEVTGALADEFHTIAPDQRGYNTSDIPAQVTDYELDHLVADIAGLLDATVDEPIVLVAHDWGGPVAWVFTHLYPERVAGLVVLNGPHPDVFGDALANHAGQQQAASYMNFFISDQAEPFFSANDYANLIGIFDGALSADEETAHRAAYGQTGSLTGMLNWYRANIETGPMPKMGWPANVTIAVPTLVMWGMDDTALLPDANLTGLGDYVSDLDVRMIDDADHWVVHRQTATVIDEIRTFARATFGAP
jgi:pimeloyl-ACP methyl ester carboxylesterase